MKNTMDEMIYINNLIKNNSYKSILIVTSPTHSRRVDFLIKKFNPELINKYTIVSSNPPWWHKNFYFLNLKAISLSFLEFFKLIHNYIKYNFLENTKLERYLDFISNNTKSYLYKTYGL